MGYATEEQAEALFEAFRVRDKERQKALPTTLSALDQIHVATERLRSMGWSAGQYCPKNGTPFAAVSFGSTGIFEAFFMGEWPSGSVYMCDFMYSADALWWKPLDDLTDDERAQLERCMKDELGARERMISSFIDEGERSDSNPTPPAAPDQEIDR